VVVSVAAYNSSRPELFGWNFQVNILITSVILNNEIRWKFTILPMLNVCL